MQGQLIEAHGGDFKLWEKIVRHDPAQTSVSSEEWIAALRGIYEDEPQPQPQPKRRRKTQP